MPITQNTQAIISLRDLSRLLSELDSKIQEDLRKLRLPSITRGIVVEITINDVFSNSDSTKQIRNVLCPIMELELERLSDDNLGLSQGIVQIIKNSMLDEPFDFHQASDKPEWFNTMQKDDICLVIRVFEISHPKELIEGIKVQDIGNLKQKRDSLLILEDTYFISRKQRKGLFERNINEQKVRNFKCITDAQNLSMFESNPVFQYQISEIFEDLFVFIYRFLSEQHNQSLMGSMSDDFSAGYNNDFAKRHTANFFLNKSWEQDGGNKEKSEQSSLSYANTSSSKKNSGRIYSNQKYLELDNRIVHRQDHDSFNWSDNETDNETDGIDDQRGEDLESECDALVNDNFLINEFDFTKTKLQIKQSTTKDTIQEHVSKTPWLELHTINYRVEEYQHDIRIKVQKLYHCIEVLYSNTQLHCYEFFREKCANQADFPYQALRDFLATLYDIEFATNLSLNGAVSEEDLRQRFVNLLQQIYLDVPNDLVVFEFERIIKNNKFVDDLPNLFQGVMVAIKNSYGFKGSDVRQQKPKRRFNPNYEYFPDDMDAVLKAEIQSHKLGKNRQLVRTLLTVNYQDLPHLSLQIKQNLKEIESELTADISCYTVIWPININTNHWVGCIVDIDPQQKKARFRFIDTMGQTAQNQVEFLKQYIRDLLGDAYTLDLLDSPVLLQSDFVSCGPYFIVHAMHYIYDESLSYAVLSAARGRHVQLLGVAFTEKQFQNQSPVNFGAISTQSQKYTQELHVRAKQLCDCIKQFHASTQAEFVKADFRDQTIASAFSYPKFREFLGSLYEIEEALNNTSEHPVSEACFRQRFVELLKQLYRDVPESLSVSEFARIIVDNNFADDIPNVFAEAIQLLNLPNQLDHSNDNDNDNDNDRKQVKWRF